MPPTGRLLRRAASNRPRLPYIALLAAVLALSGRGVMAAASIDVGDAYIHEATGGHQWTMGNGEIASTIIVTKVGVEIESFVRSGGRNVLVPRLGDVGLAYDGVQGILGDRAYRFDSATASNLDGRAVLALRFRHRDRPMVVERRYAIAPGVPVLEMWTSVESDNETTLHDLSAFSLEFAARDLAWQRGLEVPDTEGGPFSRRAARLADGDTVDFGSEVLSSRQHLPWFGLSGDGDRVTIGLAWSGSWQASVHGTPAGAVVDLGLPGAAVIARPGQAVEYPHAFLALTSDAAGDDARALMAWALARRGGRGFPALVTYNTWFQFGINIDDAVMRRQMDAFAAIGGELFELDAGWYPSLDPVDRYDFSAGLGTWQVDRTRFPSGLGALSDYAHQRGLKFGVWVEPERVDFATVGRSGLAQERFLARQNGQYQPGRDNSRAEWAQICLATEEGWAWVRDRLFTFLAEARADYVKIDLNGWAACTRDDHDHGAGGGNFGHVQGVYRLLQALHERFPNLLIENVSGGARRLDPALLALTDAAWVDDRTAPSARVRHHLELLGPVVPASSVLTYILAAEGEPIAGARDYPLLARSRMPGVLGLTTDFRDLDATDHAGLAQGIAEYKLLRGLRGTPITVPLTAPVGVDGRGQGWDVVEALNPSSGVALLYAFRNPGSDRTVHVRLAQLRAGTTYRIRSLDRGVLGTATGADLMGGGLDIDPSPRSAAHVLVVEPQ